MFFIRAHPCHPWLPSLRRGRAGPHGGWPATWPEIFEMIDTFSNQTLESTPGSARDLPGSRRLAHIAGRRDSALRSAASIHQGQDCEVR